MRKKFRDHGYFDGIVIGFELLDDGSNAALYQIEYEDNDSEDLCCIELQSILLPLLSPAQEAIAVAKIRAKRVVAINSAVTQPNPKKKRQT